MIDESSLTDFEYRVVDIPALNGRVYNQESHAKIAIVHQLTGWPMRRNKASIREMELTKHIEIRLVSRGAWKQNVREVFGLD